MRKIKLLTMLVMVAAGWGYVDARVDTLRYNVGSHTLNLTDPAEVEIYAVGGGGGGQGGHYRTVGTFVAAHYGTGGSGGGGAATYGRFYTTTATVLNVSVGAGGAGGDGNRRIWPAEWHAGSGGSSGGNTIVFLGGNALILAQGGMGGGWDRNDYGDYRGHSGGRGGVEADRPVGGPLVSYSSSSGNIGTNGHNTNDITCIGGDAGRIAHGEASINPWGGFNGSTRNIGSTGPSTAAGYGGGGSGNYNNNVGHKGGDGHVLIIVRYSYRVTFDSRGGSAVSAINGVPNATIEAPADPTNDCYPFIGWSTEPTGGRLWNFETDKVLKDITLYAQWSPLLPVVTLDSRGGAAVSAINDVPCNTAIKAPEGPANDCCAFIGWSTEPAGGQLWNFETNKVLMDTTLYAQWMPLPHSLDGFTYESGLVALEWEYSNVSDIEGAFYIYRREIVDGEPDEWDLVDMGSNKAQNGVKNELIVFIDKTISSHTTYEYLIAFVEGTVGPNRYTPPTKQTAAITVKIGEVTAIQMSDREIPGGGEESGFVVPIIKPAGEFTAGPNPVGRADGSVAIFRSGPRVQSGKLSVYDAAGNLIAKIGISDKSGSNNNGNRQVGSWNLKDRRGRAISAGSYVVKGTVVGNDGQKENVSLIIGVR